MFQKFISFHLLLLFAVLCDAVIKNNDEHYSTCIVNGFSIDIKQVPWQISLQKRERHICSGSIIDKKLDFNYCKLFRVRNAMEKKIIFVPSTVYYGIVYC